MSDIAIKVAGLGKRYRLGQQGGYKTLRETFFLAYHTPTRVIGERILRLRQTEDGRLKTETAGLQSPVSGPQSPVSSQPDHLWALKDVSFEVKRGEAVGIIGRNGSGKSTLLKILSRITAPTEGYAEIHGRVGSLLEVGTGFHPELTGRENIYLNGAIIGMKKAEIERRFDEIVAFAEIEKFLDTPVKRYSSGMYVRLAFAVAAHLEPEVLVVDEVLAVGDAGFQKKCLGKMQSATGEGRTVLFVSHNIPAVKSLCSRGLLLDGGIASLDGPVGEVTDGYMRQFSGDAVSSATFPDDPSLRIQFTHVELLRPDVMGKNETVLRFDYVVRESMAEVLLCVEVRRPDDLCVFYTNDSLLEEPRKRSVGRHSVLLAVPSHLLAPGEYVVAFGFWQPGRHPEHSPSIRLTFRREEPKSDLSSRGIAWPGLIYMPATWKYVGKGD